jgi:very-short-patch-repair endonuclease
MGGGRWEVVERGDEGLATLAGAQRGVAHRAQILSVGIGAGSIRHRVSRGSLHPVLPSVFAVGHPVLEPLGFETAALLYAGDDAVLSHASAAWLWGLCGGSPDRVSVTVARRKVRHRPGVRLHQVASLDGRDARLQHGLPVTAPARALIDFAADQSDGVVAAALNEARVLKLVTDADLRAALDRCQGRTGTARVNALLAAERGPALTRSEAERVLKQLLEAGQLPLPQFNVWVHGKLVDALWPAERLIVETDGYRFHGHRAAFENDRLRDQRLAAEGYLVMRITWRQLTGEPMAVLARLAQALATRQRRGVNSV